MVLAKMLLPGYGLASSGYVLSKYKIVEELEGVFC